jgi:hypothetical protein
MLYRIGWSNILSRISGLLVFGEHILSLYPDNPVALVEAPKTAVYGTLYFGMPYLPGNLIWLAVYNKSSFTFDKLKALQGRDVYVFPDLSKDGSTFSEWQQKADKIAQQLPGTRFIFSDLLEQFAPDTDRCNGNDLADFLIKLDWRNFRKQEKQFIHEASAIPQQISENGEASACPEKTFISPDATVDNDEVFQLLKKI